MARNIPTPYYIDYIYDRPKGEKNFYYQLVRKADNAILYAHEDLKEVLRRRAELNIKKENICIL